MKLDSLSKTQDIPKGFKDNYEISVDLARATFNAKERVYDDMVKLLEQHANNHFQNLTVNNDLSWWNFKV